MFGPRWTPSNCFPPSKFGICCIFRELKKMHFPPIVKVASKANSCWPVAIKPENVNAVQFGSRRVNDTKSRAFSITQFHSSSPKSRFMHKQTKQKKNKHNREKESLNTSHVNQGGMIRNYYQDFSKFFLLAGIFINCNLDLVFTAFCGVECREFQTCTIIKEFLENFQTRFTCKTAHVEQIRLFCPNKRRTLILGSMLFDLVAQKIKKWYYE